MRTVNVCLALCFSVAFTLSAAESDVILRAQQDALEDGQDYHAYWWGIGGVAVTTLPVVYLAFFSDAISVRARRLLALSVPPVGGISLPLIGYFTGKAELPDARIAEIKDELNDARLQLLYATEYRKTLTKIQRSKRGSAALLGAGVSIGVMGLGFLVVYLAK
jgi:hypothetical protein